MPFKSNEYQINTMYKKVGEKKYMEIMWTNRIHEWLLSKDAIGNKTTHTKILNASAPLRVEF